MIRRKRNNGGFTLVELSIVLVIIGLIIGGVLTGRQIMQNAQITSTVNSIQSYEAQFQTYVQNYGAIPGNDSSATARFPSASVSNGSGLGTLVGTFDSAVATDAETNLVWADLRAAGLVKNQVAGTASIMQPPNVYGGLFGFQHSAFGGALPSNVLCLNNVPADAAAAIDSRLDDGGSNTGSIQSMAEPTSGAVLGEAVAGTPATTYGVGQTYTMCVTM